MCASALRQCIRSVLVCFCFASFAFVALIVDIIMASPSWVDARVALRRYARYFMRAYYHAQHLNANARNAPFSRTEKKKKEKKKSVSVICIDATYTVKIHYAIIRRDFTRLRVLRYARAEVPEELLKSANEVIRRSTCAPPFRRESG